MFSTNTKQNSKVDVTGYLCSVSSTAYPGLVCGAGTILYKQDIWRKNFHSCFRIHVSVEMAPILCLFPSEWDLRILYLLNVQQLFPVIPPTSLNKQLLWDWAPVASTCSWHPPLAPKRLLTTALPPINALIAQWQLLTSSTSTNPFEYLPNPVSLNKLYLVWLSKSVRQMTKKRARFKFITVKKSDKLKKQSEWL